MVGTIQEVLEVRREKKQLEEISDWEMSLLPKGIRIDIPLKSATHMHRVGVVLVEYGEAMQRVSKRKELTSFHVLDRCWSMAREVRRRIEEICNMTRAE
jgi:alanine racemase